MTDIQPFNYEGQQMRTVYTDGDIEFVAADVCRILGHSNPSAAVAGLDDDETGLRIVETPSGDQKMVTVTEPGLYSLIIRSRRPEAKAFRRWVTHVVLPQIRKIGSYGTSALSTTDKLALGFEAMQEIVAAKDAEIAEKDDMIAELAPAAQHWDEIIARNGDVDVRAAAQWLSTVPGIDTGQNRLWAYLRQVKWVDKKNRPYQHIIERGLLASRYDGEWTDPIDGTVHIKSTTMVRMKGLALLRKSLGPQEQAS